MRISDEFETEQWGIFVEENTASSAGDNYIAPCNKVARFTLICIAAYQREETKSSERGHRCATTPSSEGDVMAVTRSEKLVDFYIAFIARRTRAIISAHEDVGLPIADLICAAVRKAEAIAAADPRQLDLPLPSDAEEGKR